MCGGRACNSLLLCMTRPLLSLLRRALLHRHKLDRTRNVSTLPPTADPSPNLQRRAMSFTNVNITFLGTASAQPSSTRNHSSLALRLNGDIWLFDCGEATQHRAQKATLKVGKIQKIFITHTHGEEYVVTNRELTTECCFRRPYLWFGALDGNATQWGGRYRRRRGSTS